MSQRPLISVLIDNYNYGRFVGQAIDSALKQTYMNIEVIVIDDGSTDNSREIIASFGDRIISVFQKNGGQTSALNAGFASSRGEWLFLLDSDDLFEPHKVQTILDLADNYPNAAMIAHDLEYCSSTGNAISFAAPYITKLTLVDDRELAHRGSLSVSLPAHSGLCIRRDLFKQLWPLPDAVRMGIDNYIKWTGLSLFPVLLVPELLGKQRIHGDNVGTIIAETGNKRSRLRLAKQNATVTFYMKTHQSHLKKLAWKQYGRILYGLKSCRNDEAKAIEKEIRSRLSVVEPGLLCFYYVGAAFAKAFGEDVLRMGLAGTQRWRTSAQHLERQ